MIGVYLIDSCASLAVRWNYVVSEFDLGKDVAFAEAVAGLSKLDLEKLRMEGNYDDLWPAYFREKFGTQVVESQGEIRTLDLNRGI